MAIELDFWTIIIVILATVLCIALGHYIDHRVPALRARGTAYLTEAAGHTANLSPSERKRLWIVAVQYVLRVLRLRRHWHSLGVHLQQPRIRDLVSG